MNREEAEQKLKEFFDTTSGQYLPAWSLPEFALREQTNGDWIAQRSEAPSEGIIFRQGQPGVPFFGALGKLVLTPEILGFPVLPERLLGSAIRGRYQTFERGLAVWEEFSNGNEIGFPVAGWKNLQERARKCRALVAFFDLRGFTGWSGRAPADEIQGVIEVLENHFQNAFSASWSKKLFAKSTGDGFMVVSEKNWYSDATTQSPGVFQAGHIKRFCSSCAHTILDARIALVEKGLVIGCGITTGEITQLYVLGRPDYTGPAVNQASKIQSSAYDEICISDDATAELKTHGVRISGKRLPGTGRRISAEELRDATA